MPCGCSSARGSTIGNGSHVTAHVNADNASISKRTQECENQRAVRCECGMSAATFEQWLELQLEALESRFAEFETRQSQTREIGR